MKTKLTILALLLLTGLAIAATYTYKPKRENEKMAPMAQLTQSQRDGEAFRGPICSPCG